jgi:hypothetical protein
VEFARLVYGFFDSIVERLSSSCGSKVIGWLSSFRRPVALTWSFLDIVTSFMATVSSGFVGDFYRFFASHFFKGEEISGPAHQPHHYICEGLG